MATGFDVDTDKLLTLTEKIEQSAASLKNAANRAYEQVGELDSMWDGAANQAFTAQFTNDFQEIESFLQSVHEYSNAIKNAARKYESNESEVVNTMSRLG